MRDLDLDRTDRVEARKLVFAGYLGRATGAVTLHILPKRHALRSVSISAGQGDQALGKVVVAAGQTLKGRLREFDGARVLHAFVALENADGVRVRRAELGPGGSFELPGIGAAEVVHGARGGLRRGEVTLYSKER